MAQIGSRVFQTNRATTIGIDRPGVILKSSMINCNMTTRCKQPTIPGVAGWHHAVEHINTPSNAFNEVSRGAYAHQIPWPIRRKGWFNFLDHLVHSRYWFPNGKPPQSIALKLHFHQTNRTFLSEFFIDSALHNTEQSLRLARFGIQVRSAPSSPL